MTRSVRGAVFFSVFANYGALIITFGLTVLVSRLLTPSQVGAFVVVSALILLIDTLREMNVGTYVVQAPEVDAGVLRSAFGLSLLVSIPTALMMIAGAELIGKALGQPDLAPLIRVMALTYIIAPLTQPAVAMLNRTMHFQELMMFRLGAALGRATITIALILDGMGAMALAWGYFAGKLAEVIILIFTRTSHKFVLPSFKRLRPIFSYGWKATGAQFVSSMGVSSADLAMGGFLGLTAAGLYSRGMSLVAVYRTGIEQALSPVVFSAFAQERRNPNGDLRKIYLHSLTLLTAVGWPAFAVLAILARPLVLVLFGDRWVAAIPVAEILALSGMIYVISSLAPRLLSALGKVGLLLKRELAIQIPRIAMILIGAQYSIIGVALAITGTYALAFVVNQSVLQSVVAINYRDLWHAVKSSVAVAFVAGATTMTASRAMLASGAPPLLELILSALATGLSWFAAVFLLNHPIKHEVLTTWRHVRRRLSSI